MRGGRRGGLWSEEEIASSGTGSERAQDRERSRGDPSASQGPREPAPLQWGAPWAEQARTGGRPPGLHSRRIPACEARCIPAGFVARPHRTAVGTPRSCASPVGAHRPSRCTASSGTEPETPAGAFREEGQAQTRGVIARRATERGPPPSRPPLPTRCASFSAVVDSSKPSSCSFHSMIRERGLKPIARFSSLRTRFRISSRWSRTNPPRRVTNPEGNPSAILRHAGHRLRTVAAPFLRVSRAYSLSSGSQPLFRQIARHSGQMLKEGAVFLGRYGSVSRVTFFLWAGLYMNLAIVFPPPVWT